VQSHGHFFALSAVSLAVFAVKGSCRVGKNNLTAKCAKFSRSAQSEAGQQLYGSATRLAEQIDPKAQYASRIRRSRRLLPVGPVTTASPNASKNGCASNLSRAAAASSPCACARATVVPSATAPAAVLLPSIPSVPALSTVTFSPAIPCAHASANCWFRPPTPPLV